MAEHIAASDLVALIGQLYPKAATTGDLTMLDDGHAGELALILEYVKRIDPRVLRETLSADEIRRWERASARMEATSRTWGSGGRATRLAPPGGNDPHPLIQVLLTAKRLPDQAKPVSVNRLPFVKDADLRQNIATDVDSMERHLREGEWKSTMVLAGSIIEALLLDSMLSNVAGAQASAAKLGLRHASQPPEEWDLAELVKVAEDLGIISKRERDAADQARNYRNLIHPGRARRLAESATRGAARLAAGAVDEIIRRLTP